MSYLEYRRKLIENGRPLPPKKKYVIPKKSAKRIQKEKEQGIEIVKPKRKAGWFVEPTQVKTNVLPTEFSPTKEQLDDANDVVKEFKLGERGKSELWDWFLDRREEMVGVCQHCSKPSLKNSDRFFHHSVCHILPKSKNLFPSVATNVFNWLELCQECHNNLDNHMIDITELNCFNEVIEKITKIYPHIAKEERRRIPAILMEYIKTEL